MLTRLLQGLLPERMRRAVSFLEEAEAAHTDAAPRAVPSLAQEALLVAIDPGTGKVWNNATYAVPAALLLELVHEGRLDVSGDDRKARLALRDSAPLGDPELDDAILTIGAGFFGSRATRYVRAVPQAQQLLRRLVSDGVVVEETHTRLGTFTIRRYHPAPAAGRDEIVARLRAVLLGEAVPDARTALLLASLVDVHPKLIVGRQQVREATRRRGENQQRIGEAERTLLTVVHHVQTRSESSG